MSIKRVLKIFFSFERKGSGGTLKKKKKKKRNAQAHESITGLLSKSCTRFEKHWRWSDIKV